MKSISSLLAVPVAVILLMLSPGQARAHVVEAGADLRVTQTFAAGEVTLVVTGVSRVPAPLRVHAEGAQEMDLTLELRSLTDGGTSSASVTTGLAPAVLQAGHAGPYELRVRAGDEVSVIPFRVLVPASAWWTQLADGAFLALGLLLVGGVLAGGMSRPLVGAASAAGAVAVVVVLLTPHLPAPVPAGAAPATGAGRPYAQGRFSTQPAQPVSGTGFTVTLRLADGATGRPVDDLTVHHEAPVHLVVTSQDGAVFRHVHPLRTAPGVLVVRLNLPRPGRYLAYAEIERQGSGGQLVSGAFDVVGAPQPEAVLEAATPRLVPPAPIAGSPVTVEVEPEGPVQPWLGMPGHLVVRSADGLGLSHAHGIADRSVLSFTLTLPEPGHYLAWVQYVADGRLRTRSFTLEVDR